MQLKTIREGQKQNKNSSRLILNNSFRYLGVLVGRHSSRLSAWDDTIDKLKARLSKWKMKTLLIGGRFTLLKSVLGATPIYNMSIFKVPRGDVP
uniref:RNA-directed DNA polymerase, eukaryota, reverse transcriptase zinc-binding domain protein n=1 Tax=Tanacetum cinerariifolium TaxID=118510 RepID=A0A699HZR8_TANCI|nr:RNA-directed DNA polymerase, eukaryota, reverse transcriptase zinc-binding domain protein [Tanacetum cinerariifolium]